MFLGISVAIQEWEGRQNVALPTVALEGNTKPWVLHYWQLQLDLCCDMCGNKTSAECHRHSNKTGCWNGIQSNTNCLVGFLIFLPSCRNNHHMYSKSIALGLLWPFLICIADVSAVIVIVTMKSMSLMNWWFEISISGLAGSLVIWLFDRLAGLSDCSDFFAQEMFLTSLTENLGVHPNVGTTTSHLLQINSSTIANGAILIHFVGEASSWSIRCTILPNPIWIVNMFTPSYTLVLHRTIVLEWLGRAKERRKERNAWIHCLLSKLCWRYATSTLRPASCRRCEITFSLPTVPNRSYSLRREFWTPATCAYKARKPCPTRQANHAFAHFSISQRWGMNSQPNCTPSPSSPNRVPSRLGRAAPGSQCFFISS